MAASKSLATRLPSYSTGPITARDEIEPPRISIDPEYTQAVVVKAGDNFRIDANVHGKPLPSITWLKGEQEMGNTIHREIKNTATYACVAIKEAKLSDGGAYTLLLRNPGGEKAVQVNVVVLDKPGEPQGPLTVTDITKDQCCLSWKAPIQDGGSKISHYSVERRETSRLIWTIVDPKVLNTCHKVTKLLEGNEYIFRVHAINEFGSSAPLVSEPVIIKDPYTAPGSPKGLEIADVKKDSMVLTWEAPNEDGEYDGGSRVRFSQVTFHFTMRANSLFNGPLLCHRGAKRPRETRSRKRHKRQRDNCLDTSRV
uniref:Titin n=1 Tax=Hippocampus comes TaxID=109280 RepID=A0A3Q2Z4C7_HIPCM